MRGTSWPYQGHIKGIEKVGIKGAVDLCNTQNNHDTEIDDKRIEGL